MNTNAEVMKEFAKAVTLLQEELNRVKPEDVAAFSDEAREVFENGVTDIGMKTLALHLEIFVARRKTKQALA